MKSTTKRKRDQTQDSSSSDEDQPRTSAPSRKRQRNGKEPAVSVSSSEDDDLPIVTPKTKRAAKKSAAPLPEKPKAQQPSEDSDEESPLFSPKSARRNRGRVIVLEDSDSDEEPRSSPVKKRRLVRRDRSSPPEEAFRASDDDDDEDDAEMEDRPPPSTARRAVRRPRTEKEKAMEVLRRKKAGEKITLEDLTDSDEDDARPLYDSDTDSEHQALHQFDDDSEGVPEDAPAESGSKSKKGKNKASKKDKKKKKKNKSSEDSGDNNTSADDNLDGFVVEDGPMGIPADALAEIPLEFTRHSHKPLRDHFRDVLLWLILDRVFPGFAERKHELYRIAWQKLDDEISGLAQSKFASSAWRSDFIMALRARPQFINEQIDGESLQSCGACGRSGHPATYVVPPRYPPTPTDPQGSYKIQFLGTPYYKGFNSPSFLHDVDPPSSSASSSSSSSPPPSGDRDEDSNPIAPSTTTWAIGSVCSRNAETAHLLIHWKKALQDWAELRLSEDGHLAPTRLAERLGWKARKKNKLAQKILDEWEDKGYAKLLYKEYQAAVDKAREASTSGRGRGYGQGGN